MHAEPDQFPHDGRIVHRREHHDFHVGVASAQVREERNAVAIDALRHRVVGDEHVARDGIEQLDDFGRILRGTGDFDRLDRIKRVLHACDQSRVVVSKHDIDFHNGVSQAFQVKPN